MTDMPELNPELRENGEFDKVNIDALDIQGRRLDQGRGSCCEEEDTE